MARMHADEVEISPALVRRLLTSQFPQWADLSLTPIPSAGTDNSIYRLGDELAVRLPRRPGATESLDKEIMWLPKIAPHLPLQVPTPLGVGKPEESYPWQWYVYRWMEGTNAVNAPIEDEYQAAQAIAQFINALRRIDAADGPCPGSHNFNRGEPLQNRDAFTRAGIASLPDSYDKATLTAVWESTLRVPVWEGAPVWIHGDLHAGNLLTHEGRLTAVIDFGGLGVGDPACDIAVAWNLFSAQGRGILRDSLLGVDDAMWVRGRGWSLSVWVGGVAYYQDTYPLFAQMADHAIRQVLDDYRHEQAI
jgi:aminoglycoside phosphotransferase (APT) family kinase protein